MSYTLFIILIIRERVPFNKQPHSDWIFDTNIIFYKQCLMCLFDTQKYNSYMDYGLKVSETIPENALAINLNISHIVLKESITKEKLQSHRSLIVFLNFKIPNNSILSSSLSEQVKINIYISSHIHIDGVQVNRHYSSMPLFFQAFVEMHVSARYRKEGCQHLINSKFCEFG